MLDAGHSKPRYLFRLTNREQLITLLRCWRFIQIHKQNTIPFFISF
jgi:hypothetical protein